MRRDLGPRAAGLGDEQHLASTELHVFATPFHQGRICYTDTPDILLKLRLEDDGSDVLKSQKYPAKLHARKVVEELGVKSGLIYLPGQPTQYYEDSDMTLPFRQRKYFFYITGFNYPDCAVTYDVSSDSSTLWIPYVEPRQALYFGSPPDPAKIKAKYDVDHVKYTDELASYLRKELGSKTVYLLHPTQLSDLHLKSISGHCGIDTSSLLPAMNRARVVKTPYEIAMIRKACAVSALGHRRIMQHLLRMTNEREIQAVFEAVCTSRGARDLAYGTIVGAGENGATLHYDDNDQPLGSKATVVVDAGCEWAGYASDITRTLPLAGRFEGRAAEIHGIVQLMQDCCIKEARTGQPYRQLHLLAAHIAIDGLHTLGILKGDKEEIRRQGTIGAFFPHGLGHHVGLEVHDVSGDLPLLAAGANSGHHLRATKRCFLGPDELSALDRVSGAESRPVSKLEPGMVVTIEPGIYFCRPYLEGNYLNNPKHRQFIDTDVLKTYYEVGGVRIEDVILINEEGNENLSAAAPKGQELEDVINDVSGTEWRE